MREIRARSVTLIKGLPVLDQPELIRVLTIKKKHVDEMSYYNNRMNGEFSKMDKKFLGRYGQTIIFAAVEEGRLYKMEVIDFIRACREEEIPAAKANEMAYSLPELFTT